jgi:hypothetical protein
MMHLVELYSTENCGLCEEASKILKALQETIPFELRDVKLTPEDPHYAKYFLSTPVVRIDGTVELPAPLDVHRVADLLKSDQRPGAPFYIGKGLEALGLISVACGLTMGLIGDLRTEGYLLVGGVVFFFAGWLIERRHRREFPSTAATSSKPVAPTHE